MENPQLAFVCEIKVKIDQPLIIGQTPHGFRRVIPLMGGTFEGPDIAGEILEGGADWQLIRDDGVTELEAHYQLKTTDGVIIYLKNVGLRVATPEISGKIARGEVVSPNEYYFTTLPKFEVAASKYEWMNNTIFIAKGIRNADNVAIRVWKVL